MLVALAAACGVHDDLGAARGGLDALAGAEVTGGVPDAFGGFPAKLVILYGHPAAPAAFEEYYANRHLPYAAKHMPNVRGAENMRVISAAEGDPAPYYRISQLTYDSVEDLLAGIASEEARSTIADLANFATGGATLLITADDE